MAQVLNLQISGLYTDPNPFSEVPEGALAVADNVVIDKESVIETRRGQKQYGDLITATTTIDRMFEYQDTLICHHDTTLKYDSDGLGTWINYSGTYAHPDSDFLMRSFQHKKNFYFTTSSGVKVLDLITNTPIESGAYKALGGEAATTGTSGFMTNDTAIAYRVVWVRVDVNDNLILGTPSQRVVATNTSGGTRDVSLTFDIPDGVTTDWKYQIYRSSESASAATTPDDELQLVYEDNPTSGEITAQVFTVTDTTPDSLKGAALYTNQTQETILQTNDAPPFCKDMTEYKSYTLFANTKTKHRYTLDLISTGSPDGIQVNDTITIDGNIYTGKATETASANEFLVDTSGTPAQNIDATTISLIKVINQDTSNTTVYAYYLSGFDDAPGKLLLEEKSIGGSSFAVISSRSTCWIPKLPSSGTTESSVNDEFPNRIYVSKSDQPEAVPLLNYFSLGSADKPIQRIIALRDSVMVFKDDGIYRITGQTFPFSSYLFNNSVKLQGNETAVVLDNRIYAMTDQGVVAVHDSGVEIISRPIESSLVKLLGEEYTYFKSTAFGIGYESDRRYILYTVSETTDETPNQAWSYSTITQSWTRWTTPRSSGIVKNDDDKLYTAHATSDYVYKERKNFDTTDYADEQFDVNIISFSGNDVTLSAITNVLVGQTLTQGKINGLITDINGTVVTVSSTHTWAAGTATTNNPINNVIEWVENDCGNIGLTKHFQECTFAFRSTGFDEITALFSGSFIDNKEVSLVPLNSGATWGGGIWGQTTWGSAIRASLIRTLIPRDTQRSNWIAIRLTLNESYTSFSLVGVSIHFKEIGSKIK